MLALFWLSGGAWACLEPYRSRNHVAGHWIPAQGGQSRAAACRAESPSAEAFKTRPGGSSLHARAIVHLINDHAESAGWRLEFFNSSVQYPDFAKLISKRVDCENYGNISAS